MKRLLLICVFALSENPLAGGPHAMELPLPQAESALVAPDARRCFDDINTLFRTSPAFEDGTYKVKLWSPMPKVVFLLFETQVALTKTFVRFQEHFESPHFRQTAFSYKEFVRWYRADKGTKQFTYFTDWSGMNFPSTNLAPFKRGDFDPLSQREQWLLDLLKTYGDEFYLIATYSDPHRRIDGGMMSTLRHELSHALYFLNPVYRAKVQKILARVDLSALIALFDKRGGYHASVYPDEFHAYLLNDTDRLQKWGLDLTPYAQTTRDLSELFEGEYRAWKNGVAGSASPSAIKFPRTADAAE